MWNECGKQKKKRKRKKKKLEQLQKELQEERQIEELRRLQTESGLITHNGDRLDWMYSGPLAHNTTSSEEYLQGKELRQDKEEEDINKLRGEPGSLFLSSSVNPELEEANRLRDDPLMHIKTEEHKIRSSILNNPIKIKQLKQHVALTEQLKKAMKERKKAMKKAKKEKKKSKKKKNDSDSDTGKEDREERT